MDSDEDFPTVRFEDVVSEIEEHKASHLVSCERNSVNGYVTFKFYSEDGYIKGKLTFDELSEDTSHRAKAVLDYLSTATDFVIYQDDVETVWDRSDPEIDDSIPKTR